MPQIALTEAEYWSEVQLLSTEIEHAIIIFHTYEEINRLLLHDPAVFKSLNKEPEFWQIQRYCQQTTLFLTLSRIFDTEANAHTIHTLVNATLGNLQIFSTAALAARKSNGGPKPYWLDDYIANAWVPREGRDLRHLKTALGPHATRFKKIYQPIRHAIYAHRLMSDDRAGAKLFGATNRDEVGRILDFLHDLVESIRNLYTNGDQPVLGKRDFTEFNQRIRDGASRVLKGLP